MQSRFLKIASQRCRSSKIVGLGLTTLMSCMLCASIPAKTPTADRPIGVGGAQKFYGVNLAGGEFKSEVLPGKLGQDYIYPDKSVAQPFVTHGFNTVRVPILWERLQPSPFKPLSDTEMQALDASIDAIDGFSNIVLDVHNYASYRGQRLDQIDGGGLMLADLWTRLAQHYIGSKKIIFGIMNEPHDIDPHDWRKMVDQSVAAIRKAGAKNLLLIPGSNWTGAHSWTAGGSSSNAAAFSSFKDPDDNFVYELHQYLDTDSSGTHDSCVDANLVRARMSEVTEWLRTHEVKAFLGEFGGPQGAECLASLDALMNYTDMNNDVWVGWTYWAGGPWWGDYSFSVQPRDGHDKAQITILRKHFGH